MTAQSNSAESRLGHHMFELRTLRYFLTFVQEGGVSNASKALHITQPTLSRQLAELEKNIGGSLYVKNSRRIQLTEQGSILYEYAKTIVELCDHAEEQLSAPNGEISGTIRIGAGETTAMKIIAQAASAIQADHPKLSIHITSGASMDLMENLNKGLLDFMLECETKSRPGYESLKLPVADRWVALIPEDDPLASKQAVYPYDFEGRNVALSRQALKAGKMKEWFGDSLDALHVVATHNLTLNSTFFARARMASVFTYEGLYNIPGLASKPLAPELTSESALIWTKKRNLSDQARIFLEYMHETCESWAE